MYWKGQKTILSRANWLGFRAFGAARERLAERSVRITFGEAVLPVDAASGGLKAEGFCALAVLD